MKETPLVISFGGTLRSMAREAIIPSELDGAIFYLGCTEAHAKNEDAALQELQGSPADQEARRYVYRQFRAALDAAEGQGRVAWRGPGMLNNWPQLNQLLANNNLPTITPVDLDWPQEGRYSYSAVAKAVQEQDLPYDVIGNCE